LTENAAKTEEELFRFAVHADGAKNWRHYNSNDLARNDSYKQKLAATRTPMNIVSLGSNILNCAEKSQLSKLRKISPDLSRLTYTNIFSSNQYDDGAKQRFLRSLNRNRLFERKRNDRIDYLRWTRESAAQPSLRFVVNYYYEVYCVCRHCNFFLG
jgi:hypothetical protein